MPRGKKFKAEKIIAKLRVADVALGKGQAPIAVAAGRCYRWLVVQSAHAASLGEAGWHPACGSRCERVPRALVLLRSTLPYATRRESAVVGCLAINLPSM